MKQTFVTVKSKKQRTNQARATRVTKSAHDAISRADLLHLHHCAAFARSVRSIETFREDPVKIAAGFLKPFGGGPLISRRRRKTQIFGRSEIQTPESFEKLPAFLQGPLQIHLSILSKEIEHDVHCRIRCGQFLNAARGWVQAQLQFIK